MTDGPVPAPDLSSPEPRSNSLALMDARWVPLPSQWGALAVTDAYEIRIAELEAEVARLTASRDMAIDVAQRAVAAGERLRAHLAAFEKRSA